MGDYSEKYAKFKKQVVKRKKLLPMLIALQTILFGLFLAYHQGFLETRGAYIYLVSYLDDYAVSALLIALAVIYAAATLMNWRKTKRLFLVSLQFVWSLFFFSFLIREIAGYPNTAWVFILGLNLLIYFESRTGDY
ncbi:hypothetical protein HB825_03685 [Listeria booriae]|uniref:hypothetical protein n=1 Tax=Listeria booriae TaxID=1552123 RepID=UPI00162652B2|nr:hypothetical protein [Listeria booriae]MBC1919432.1 hypothetical protein [Listeria booriae]MBC2067037.1 hypothetical protein [Listeria booriae]MBC6133933.1 hypothetical protein [Listeria booriae]